MSKRTGRIHRPEGDIWAEPHSTPPSTEFADACFGFRHTFIKVREDSYAERWDDWLVQHTKAALIWDTDSFTARGIAHQGQLITDDLVMESLTTFNSRVQRKADNLYWNADDISSEYQHTSATFYVACIHEVSPLNYVTYFPTWNTHIQTTLNSPHYVTDSRR
jgi:hypothetical protein